MRIVICWEEFSGYMGACWRAWAAMPDVELHVISSSSIKAFDERIMEGISYHLLSEAEAQNAAVVRSMVAGQRPDVLVLCGWRFKPYVKLAVAPELVGVKRVLTMDTALRLDWRQWAGRIKLAGYLRRMDRVVVGGERSWQYARYLRVPEIKLRRGMYGFDGSRFLGLHGRRLEQAGGWPRRFLYMGRYVPDKAIDVMIAAYAKYRRSVSDPWPLTCCGTGPLGSQIAGDGVSNRGFVQPPDQPPMLLEHGVLLMLSRFEPWGVALAEAMASGMPAICTEACGASVELLRSHYNGLSVATNDVDGAAAAMRWMHEHWAELPEMGRRAAELATPWSAEFWARRWQAMCRELMNAEG